MISVLVSLIETIVYKLIPNLPSFTRTPLYRKFLLLRKLRDYLIMANGSPSYQERLDYAKTARSNEELICNLQSFNNKVSFSKLEASGNEIFKFEPKSKKDNQIGIYFHGGGYFYCGINSHKNFISNLADDLQITIYFFHYRLAPEHTFPAAHNDAKQVVEYIETIHPEENKIWIGESAGGNLAASICIDESFELKPSALVLMSPWLDLSDKLLDRRYLKNKDILITLDGMVDVGSYYSKGYDTTDPLISPVFGDVSNFPPVFLQVASNELLFNDAIEFNKKLNSSNVECTLDAWDNLWHAWQFFPINEAKEARKRIAEFINKLELINH